MPVPFIPAPNCVRSSFVYNLDNQIVVNTFHFRFNTDPTIIEMGSLNTALHTWYTASFKAALHTSLTLQQIVSVNLSTQTGAQSTLVLSPAEAGSNAGSPLLPSNVAWCASLRTLNRGRNFRGRLYVPSLTETLLSAANTLSVASQGTIQTALAQLMTPANVANFAYVVISKFLNNLPRTSAINTLITAIAGDQTLDSQRRRLPGRGA